MPTSTYPTGAAVRDDSIGISPRSSATESPCAIVWRWLRFDTISMNVTDRRRKDVGLSDSHAARSTEDDSEVEKADGREGKK